MLHTTFALAKQAGACKDSYCRYAKHVGGIQRYGRHTPIPLTDILDVLGLEDALWCLRAVLPDEEAARDRLTRLYACDCAEHVAHLWIAPRDITWTPADTISVARRYALGQATDAELRAARAAAWTTWAAWAAARAAWAAREAAWTTSDASLASAWTAACLWQTECLRRHLTEEAI